MLPGFAVPPGVRHRTSCSGTGTSGVEAGACDEFVSGKRSRPRCGHKRGDVEPPSAAYLPAALLLRSNLRRLPVRQGLSSGTHPQMHWSGPPEFHTSGIGKTVRFAAITAERIPKECLEKIRYAEPLSCQGIPGVTGCPSLCRLAPLLYKIVTNRLVKPYVFGPLLEVLQESSRRNILVSFAARSLGSRNAYV